MIYKNNIMVVEDNPINLRLIKTVLTKLGYNVMSAEDAETALATLKEYHPDLILMDLQLPGIDGLQLTKILKDNPKTSHIIILAMTAFAMKGDEEKALQGGCDGYISKPIDILSLPTILNGYLDKKTE